MLFICRLILIVIKTWVIYFRNVPFSITETDYDDDAAAAPTIATDAVTKGKMRAFHQDIYFHMLNLHTFRYCMHINHGILNAMLHVVKIVCYQRQR